MKEASYQAEGLLLDSEKRDGMARESTEKMETRLKVLLVQQSREAGSDDLVAQTAKTLAACLRSRGDWAQAEQYAMMATNLERRGGGLPQRSGWRVHSKIHQPEAGSSLWQERAPAAGANPHSIGESLRLLMRAFRG